MGFAQITFKHLPKTEPAVKQHTHNFLTEGFKELNKVWHQLKDIPVLKKYLTAFFFYSMGVQTVMLAATVFGDKVLHLPAVKLIVTVVIIQLVAVVGANIMSALSAKYGNIKVLMGVVLIWIGICVAAYMVAELAEKQYNTEYGFYGLAMAVGLVMGGIQSLSRSTYAKLMPVTKDTASFFSFYDVTEKIAIVIGMFSFGFIDELAGMKNSVLALVVFFIAGFIFLFFALQKQKQHAVI
jgi:UMF1 family MFS transporter